MIETHATSRIHFDEGKSCVMVTPEALMTLLIKWKYTQGGCASFPTALIACLYDKQI